MSATTDFKHSSQATLEGVEFAALRLVLLHEAEEHGLPVETNSDAEVVCATPLGNFSARPGAGGTDISVGSDQEDWLFMLKEGIVQHLAASAPDAAAAVRWSDAPVAGSMPPNFHFVTVEDVSQVSTDFLRVRVRGDDLHSFAQDQMHFRLVLPKPGESDPQWPWVGENGQTVWPKGDKELHDPVYTTRWIDAEAGLLEFDIFVHEGGRVTDWARSLQIGVKVAIIGPGGGGVPEVSWIQLAGDETAFPAIARILEGLDGKAEGRVILEADAPDYPFALPEGFTLEWVHRPSDPGGLVRQALKAEIPEGGYFWFAAGRKDAQKVRLVLRDGREWPRGLCYISAFWGRG